MLCPPPRHSLRVFAILFRRLRGGDTWPPLRTGGTDLSPTLPCVPSCGEAALVDRAGQSRAVSVRISRRAGPPALRPGGSGLDRASKKCAAENGFSAMCVNANSLADHTSGQRGRGEVVRGPDAGARSASFRAGPAANRLRVNKPKPDRFCCQ